MDEVLTARVMALSALTGALLSTHTDKPALLDSLRIHTEISRSMLIASSAPDGLLEKYERQVAALENALMASIAPG